MSEDEAKAFLKKAGEDKELQVKFQGRWHKYGKLLGKGQPGITPALQAFL